MEQGPLTSLVSLSLPHLQLPWAPHWTCVPASPPLPVWYQNPKDCVAGPEPGLEGRAEGDTGPLEWPGGTQTLSEGPARGLPEARAGGCTAPVTPLGGLQALGPQAPPKASSQDLLPAHAGHCAPVFQLLGGPLWGPLLPKFPASGLSTQHTSPVAAFLASCVDTIGLSLQQNPARSTREGVEGGAEL